MSFKLWPEEELSDSIFQDKNLLSGKDMVSVSNH